MQKLIKLLREYEGDGFISIYWTSDLFKDDLHHHYALQIISKSYGFVKRLVENDKINRLKARNQGYDMQLCGRGFFEANTNHLIMQLALQDYPVKFLVSILK